MNTRFSDIVTVVAAFTAGICTGLMIAPASGKALRRKMRAEAESQLKSAEEKLEMIEDQLAKVNDRIQTTGKEIGDKVREATQEAVDEILPDVTKGSENWDLTKDELEKELRHMSKK